ncbi:zinc-ribbon domain-containing protein [Massiliimalia massiliensis]|uniref:zinc-ribbon domain-containing protein n=1 Tax=Massiliimalia massiliensis TaxID=1852384 RepID=UPI0009871569|nr:zinc-ribbon domain-containing protein [Massiliimalia massiliensis]
MFCAKCGAQLPDNAAFCPKCGAASSSQASSQQNSWQAQPNQADQANQSSNGWNQPPQQAAPVQEKSNKVYRALAYVPILFWLPLAFDSQDEVGRKSSNQGLLLLILNVVVSLFDFIIVSLILGSIFGHIWAFSAIGSVLSVIFSIIFWVIRILSLVCTIIGIVKATQNEYFEVPLIGKIKIIK